MNKLRLNAPLAGALFILATVTFISGSMMLDSVFTEPNFLDNAYTNRNLIIGGVLLEYVDAFAVVGIGILLFPLVMQHSSTVAISYAAARIMEGVLLLISGISPLIIVSLSQDFVADASGANAIQSIATVLLQHNMFAFQIAMLSLGIGSIPFCYLLFTEKLIPRWMALAGIIGYVALAASAVTAILGYADLANYFYIPGAIFEIIFPIWLIFRGLGTSSKTKMLTTQTA